MVTFASRTTLSHAPRFLPRSRRRLTLGVAAAARRGGGLGDRGSARPTGGLLRADGSDADAHRHRLHVFTVDVGADGLHFRPNGSDIVALQFLAFVGSLRPSDELLTDLNGSDIVPVQPRVHVFAGDVNTVRPTNELFPSDIGSDLDILQFRLHVLAN